MGKLRPASSSTTRSFSTSTFNTMGAIVKGSGPVDTNARLAALRKAMDKEQVQAYVVVSEDAHASEYSAGCDLRRAFITGFTGSAGTAIVQLDSARLFTDGRYFLQASQQLDQNWTLMKHGEKDVPTWQEYISSLESTRIGIDPSLLSASDAKEISESLNKTSSLAPISRNLVDAVWEDRPARPEHPVIVHPTEYAGQSVDEKLAAVREQLAKGKTKATGMVVSPLDEVAWLFNLRGTDIPYNPVFFGYGLVTMDEATLFVDSAKLDDSVYKQLGKSVKVRPYEDIITACKEVSSKLATGAKILIGKTASLALAEAIGQNNLVIASSPVAELKSIKNETELEGFRQSHIRDGAALTAYFAWLEETLASGSKITESQAADKLEEFRTKQAHFRGLSFTTISSTGPNAAIIHYSPDPEDCATVDPSQIYLCDSGAQYADGTTDVTRTLHFGTPSQEEIRANTRVLQGHIAIDTMKVPMSGTGCNGYRLDALARQYLWQDGLDYRHGTGHGVGSYLNVHEGPMGIGVRPVYKDYDLKPGQCISNEPGYYKDGHWGIRIENLVLIKEVETRYQFGGKWLGCEHITMAPIQTKLVDKKLLNATDVEWLNAYNAEVESKLTPLLKNDDRALTYLKRECKA